MSNDPGEKNNLFEDNKELARDLANSMTKKYNELGELPSSIIIRSDADESHLRELDIKK